jgi:sugar lactone lactonase YvrE
MRRSSTSARWVHRGDVDELRTEVWLDADDALRDGRRITVELATHHHDRVYVAAGDNATQGDAVADDPDFWIYEEDGDLLAALRVPADGPVFLNDVVVGPDGAAYVTDSITPQIFRIAREDGNWRATVWAAADAPGAPEPGGGFGLSGVEVGPDCRSLIVAQSDVGSLWRYDLETAAPLGSTPATSTSPPPRSRGEGSLARRRPQLPARPDVPAVGRRRHFGPAAGSGADRSRAGVHHRRRRRGAPSPGGQSVRR